MTSGVPVGVRGAMLRQVLTLIVALGLLAATAVIVWPKLQEAPAGLVRVDLVNATDASILEFVMDVHLPAGVETGPLPGTIALGESVTLYEGSGPMRIDSISFVTGIDGSAVDRQVRQTGDPGGVMVLTVNASGVTAEFSQFATGQD